MPDNDEAPLSTTAAFEQLSADATNSIHLLKLYISGMTPRSTEAINNLTSICEEHLKGRYELEIIDLYKHPELAGTDQILATPTLIKQLPLPLRKLVGTLSDEERVLVGLNVIKKK